MSVVSDFVVQMAESGNSSFQQLVDAGQSLQDKFLELAESDQVAEMVEVIAENIENSLPYVETFGTMLVDAFNLAQAGVTEFTRYLMIAGEAVGLFEEGTVEAFDEVGRIETEQAKKRTEQRQKEREEKKQEAARAKAEADALHQQEVAAASAKSRADEEVATSGSMNEEERAVIEPEAVRPPRRSRHRRDSEVEETNADASDTEEDLPHGFKQQAEKQLAKTRDNIVADKSLVAKQVIKNREESALTEWRVRQKKNGLMLGNGRLKRGGTKYEEHKIRSQARGRALADIRQGKVGHEEGQRAASGLTSGAAEMIKKNANLTKAQIDAMDKLTREANTRAEEAGRMQDQLLGINKRLDQALGRSANASNRAQRASN